MNANSLKRFGVNALERLRRLRGVEAPEPSTLHAAARRVFSTPDGQILLNWMLSQSYGRSTDATAPESALRENEARKRFFDQFLALGEEPSDGSDGPNSDRPKRRRSRSAGA